jgi:predicted glutamine amidotransferase
MCIIIARPFAGVVEDSWLVNSRLHHEDGVGICYVADGQMVVRKGLWDIETVRREVALAGDNDFLLHFRNASPGMTINDDNCHPFSFTCWPDKREGSEVEEDRFQFAVVHNGKIAWPNSKDYSDTYHYVKELLMPLLSELPWMIDTEWGMNVLARCLNQQGNDSNKMAIMRLDRFTGDYDTCIINRKAGSEKGLFWFSNYTFNYSPRAFTDFEHDEAANYYRSRRAHHHGPPTATHVHQPPLALLAGGNAMDRISELAKPDVHGWIWSFHDNCWKNIHTGTLADKLMNRQRPFPLRNDEPDKDKDDDMPAPKSRRVVLKHLSDYDQNKLLSEARTLLEWCNIPAKDFKALGWERRLSLLRTHYIKLQSPNLDGASMEDVDVDIIKEIKGGVELDWGSYLMEEFPEGVALSKAGDLVSSYDANVEAEKEAALNALPATLVSQEDADRHLDARFPDGY